MGAILKGKCECGYKTHELFLGGGMLSFKTDCGFPYICSSCNSLFVGNYLNEEQPCPECRSQDTVIYNDESLCHSTGKDVFNWNIDHTKSLRLTKGNYFCTNCGEFKLTFEKIGLWD